MNIKQVLIVYFSLCVFSFSSGQTSQGEVVISEESIQQLANKLYELKLARNTAANQDTKIYTKKLYTRYINNIIETDTLSIQEIENRLKKRILIERYNEVSSVDYGTKLDTISILSKSKNDTLNQTILNRLTTIENEIAKLQFSENEKEIVQQDQEKSENKTIVRNNEDNSTAGIMAIQLFQQKALNQTNAKLDSLLKINSISKADSLNNKTYSTPIADSLNQRAFTSLKNQIYVLEAKIDRLMDAKIDKDAEQKVENASTLVDTVYVEKKTEVNSDQEAYEARKLKYGNYFKQIFFANNSTKLKAEYDNIVADLVNKLNNEPKIDVSIAGYASKTGNAKYNQELSMQRAIALKKKLIEKGISHQRILTDFGGIDYKATPLAEARRLDIEFLVRK